MKIIISNSSMVPIYEQIKKAIIEEILEGNLEENDSLPSIRSLAEEIKISIMTIKKAYDELENEGYIIQVQGKGTFIAPKNKELIKENAQKELEKHLMEAVNIAKKNNISKKEFNSILDIFYGEWIWI